MLDLGSKLRLGWEGGKNCCFFRTFISILYTPLLNLTNYQLYILFHQSSPFSRKCHPSIRCYVAADFGVNHTEIRNVCVVCTLNYARFIRSLSQSVLGN